MTKADDSWLMEKVGLTPDQVRRQLGTPGSEPGPKNYLSADDQKRMAGRLRTYRLFIFARYEEGYHPDTIARMIGVSGESVRSRLRKEGFFRDAKPCERRVESDGLTRKVADACLPKQPGMVPVGRDVGPDAEAPSP